MGYRLTFEIDTAASDSNRILGRNKYAKHALFEKIKKEVYLITLGKTPEAPLEKFHITITRKGVRYLDFDNLIASFKPFIDGVKLAGIIKDDSWQYIRRITTHQELSKEKKLIITVEEA